MQASPGASGLRLKPVGCGRGDHQCDRNAQRHHHGSTWIRARRQKWRKGSAEVPRADAKTDNTSLSRREPRAEAIRARCHADRKKQLRCYRVAADRPDEAVEIDDDNAGKHGKRRDTRQKLDAPLKRLGEARRRCPDRRPAASGTSSRATSGRAIVHAATFKPGAIRGSASGINSTVPTAPIRGKAAA